jgi:transposase InsO family protein
MKLKNSEYYIKIAKISINNNAYSCPYRKINRLKKKHKLLLDVILKILKISKATYYRRVKNNYDPNKISKADKKNGKIIKKIFKKSRLQYGCRKIKKNLEKINIKMAISKIRRLMKIFNIIPKYFHKKANKRGLTGKNKYNVPDLVNRQFKTIKERFKVIYTDVTYLILKGHKAYKTTFIDAFTKEVIDTQISYKNNTVFIMKNIKNCINKIKSLGYNVKNLIIHSDHGSVYESKVYRKFCFKNKIKLSMGQTYSCTDNVVIESYHSLLKKGTIHSFKDDYKNINEYINDCFRFDNLYNKDHNSNIKINIKKVI